MGGSANILDMPRDQFMAYLPELRAGGVDTDDLLRRYRRHNSIFAPIFGWADNKGAEILDDGRRPVAAGLLSKTAGSTGMDAVNSLRLEPSNFAAGLLSGGAQAIDAPAAAAQGLIPSSDMPMEALGSAGVAMVGGAAAPMPKGALGANSINVYHGGNGDVVSASRNSGGWFSEQFDLSDEYAGPGGSVQQYSISPDRPIYFNHAEQRQTVGDIVSHALESAGDLSDDQLRTLPEKVEVLRERFGDDPRPLFEYWHGETEIPNFLRSLGFDAISVRERPSGPQTWGILDPSVIGEPNGNR